MVRLSTSLCLAMLLAVTAAPAAPAKDVNPFAVQSWVDLEPRGSSLIRQTRKLDVTARPDDDTTYLTVYGPKRKPDLRVLPREHYEPLNNPAAIPREVNLLPETNCASSAYQTIGGQAATGADLVGPLGSGRC